MPRIKKNGLPDLRGGARPGSGIPKGFKYPKTLELLEEKERVAMEKEAARQVLMQLAHERLGPMLDAQFDLATGFALIDKSDSKGEMVYDQKPDAGAGKYLIEQIMGKLKEEHDVTSGGEKLPAPIIQYIKPDEN